MVKQPLVTLWHLPRNVAIGLVRIYQMTLSPDHGPLKGLHPYGFCRHNPSCSEFAKNALHQRGFVIGSMLALKRILTCNPWKQPDERMMVEKMLNTRE